MTARAVIAYAVGLPVYVLVKALAPNFFARGDTKTPVKYSIIVLFTNLCFSIILMKPFGHVGIASATTIAAFVSFYQYYRGLRKRNYWIFPRELKIKTFKIIICSLFMGVAVSAGEALLNWYFDGWLRLHMLPKLFLLGFLCILGVATFAITAKLTGVLDIREVIGLLLHRRKKHA